MKKVGLTVIGALLIVGAIYYSNSEYSVDRKAASLPHTLGKSGEIQGRIYKYKWPLSFPPIKFIAMIKIKSKLKKMIKDLPLEEDVAKRIKKHIKTKNLRKNIIPFLLAVKEFYVPSKEKFGFTFKKHIMELYPDKNSVPGLEHTLFSYDPKKKKTKEADAGPEAKEPGTPSLLKLAATAALTLYDAIIIQDPNFRLGKRPTITPKLSKRVQGTIRKLLTQGIAILGEDHGTSKKLRALLKQPHQIEAITSTGIDVIHKYVFELHQMFALKYHRMGLLDDWLRSELKKKNQGELWNYLEEVTTKKRFSVQYVVDGLQGSLIRTLSSQGESKKFLEEVYADNQSHAKFKPDASMKPDTGHKRNLKFLEHIKKSNFSFEEEAYLPFFKDLYRNNNQGMVNQGLSTTPTLSGRNIPVTGSGAPIYGEGGTGIPNFNFLDRDNEHAYYWLGNQAFQISRYAKKHGMKSVFERLPHLYGINCSSVYLEGMNLKVDGYLTVTLGEKKRDYGEILCHFEMKKRAENYLKLQAYYEELKSLKGKIKGSLMPKAFKARKLIKKIVKLSEDSLPQYLFIYNTWPDHFSHYTGPFSDEVISPTGELNRLDFWIGQMIDLYKKAGVYDSTLWGIAGDHGLAPTYYQIDPIKLVLDPLKKKGHKFSVERITIDPENPVLVDINNRQSKRGIDVMLGVTAGGSFVFDFFLDHKENWKTHPTYEQLKSLKFKDGKEVDMIKAIIDGVGESLDYMATREGVNDLTQADVRLSTRTKGVDSNAFIKRAGDKIFYTFKRDIVGVTKLNRFKVQSDEDKETYSKLVQRCVNEAIQSDTATWCHEDEWMLLESYSMKPGGVSQLAHLYDGTKAGTVNLFPKLGISFNTHKIGRHGGDSFHEKDAAVGIWGEPVKKIFEKPYSIKSALNGTLAPTMYEYLSGKTIEKGKDGWGYHSLFNIYEIEKGLK